MVQARRNICRKVAVHAHSAFEAERAVFEVRMPTDLKLAVFSYRRQLQAAGKFAIEGKVTDVDAGIEHRSVECARALQRKVGMPLHGEAVEMNLPNPGQVEIFA